MEFVVDKGGRRIVPDWWVCRCGVFRMRSEAQCLECRQVRQDGAPAELGPLYRALRERMGLSRDRLAARTGLARGTIENIEYGRHPPQRRTLNALDDVMLGSRARVLRAVDDLLSRGGPGEAESKD